MTRAEGGKEAAGSRDGRRAVLSRTDRTRDSTIRVVLTDVENPSVPLLAKVVAVNVRLLRPRVDIRRGVATLGVGD